MTTQTATLELRQLGLRGPIALETREVTDPDGAAAKILTGMVVAFSTLVDEHEPLPAENDELEYVTSLTFTHDVERDVVGIDAQFKPDLENYGTLIEMPDSFQMMHLMVMQFLEGVGALSEYGDVDEDYVDRELPAPRQLH